MRKQAWIIIISVVVVSAIIITYLAARSANHKEGQVPLLVNGFCYGFGELFNCKADIVLNKPIILSGIGLRLGSQETVITPPEPLMFEKSFSITYTVTPSKATLTIHKTAPPSIITFVVNPLYPSKDMCKLSLMKKQDANLTSGTAFPYEDHLEPGEDYAYIAQVVLAPSHIDSAESLVSIDVKAFLLQDTLAWEFYEALPASLLPRSILIPLGGIPSRGAYYTKLIILYSKIAKDAPSAIPIELRLYRASVVHLVLRLRSGETLDAVLPIYCH